MKKTRKLTVLIDCYLSKVFYDKKQKTAHLSSSFGTRYYRETFRLVELFNLLGIEQKINIVILIKIDSLFILVAGLVFYRGPFGGNVRRTKFSLGVLSSSFLG